MESYSIFQFFIEITKRGKK